LAVGGEVLQQSQRLLTYFIDRFTMRPSAKRFQPSDLGKKDLVLVPDFFHGIDQSRGGFDNLVQEAVLILALLNMSPKCLFQLTEANCAVRRPFPQVLIGWLVQ
jgi:hypothetical protein